MNNGYFLLVLPKCSPIFKKDDHTLFDLKIKISFCHSILFKNIWEINVQKDDNHYSEANNILYDKRFSFREAFPHSLIDKGHYSLEIFCDFSSAFDMITMTYSLKRLNSMEAGGWGTISLNPTLGGAVCRVLALWTGFPPVPKKVSTVDHFLVFSIFNYWTSC